MRILITGGFGYLGGRFAQALSAEPNYEIFLGSRRNNEVPVWLPSAKIIQTQWDLPSSYHEISNGMDSVVHLAGMNAQDCVTNPSAALEVNGVITARLLHAAIRQGVKRFVYLSTAHVYGSPLSGVITEESCAVATHPYATSHRAGEDVVIAAHQRGDIEGVVIRLSNSYGAPAHTDANCWMLVVNDLCRQATTIQKMVLHSSGQQRRDFIALTDACRAIAHLLRLPIDNLDNGLFNVGGAWSPTILEMAQRVAERIDIATGSRPKIQCEKDQITGSTGLLDYRINKLTDTGFNLNSSESVDQEIDGLIHFCLIHQKTRK